MRSGLHRYGLAALAFGLANFLAAEPAGAAAREFGGHYTAERLANARANTAKHDWARQLADTAVARAAQWVARSDDDLWTMVPGQDLPRCIDVTLDTKTKGPKRVGCLGCGDKINAHGNYPYEPDGEKLPWKLTCPSCGAVFPTNDFGRYYASGIDEHGLFRPAQADRSLLFNSAHPDPKDPLHTFGVDDGFGYVDASGHAHRFIGYYAWKYWQHLEDGLSALAHAYVLTGDARYAHKAAILLDRIADVYPDMDWGPYAARGWYHSDGNSGIGKIGGRIWETFTATRFCDGYDKILSGTRQDDALFAFLKKQGERYRLPTPKGTRAQFVRHVDDRLLRTIFNAVRGGQIVGNEGMHQKTVAYAAVALNTPPETDRWLDWLFEPGGGAIPGLIVGQLDRDGISPEAGPGYALSWGAGFAEVAQLIADYGRYPKHDIFRDFPQFRATFTAAYRIKALGLATPNIGDTGATGSVDRGRANVDFIATGYRYTRDPALAVAAYRANGNSARGLGRDVFARDPDSVANEIAQHGAKAGPRPAGSSLLSGYGLALLESGTAPHGTALSLYYGRSIFHGHADHLNFDLFAFGHWLAPDHGYPEFATTWPHRRAVTINTLSHNTVVVDQKPQERGYGGHTRLFQQRPGLSVIQTDAREAYPQVKEYTRTMILIDAPASLPPAGPGRKTGVEARANSYVVDLFQVIGGADHLYSFHGPPGDITPGALALVAQTEGTYAGPLVPLKSDQGPVGYSWWYHVRRDARPPVAFTLDWKAQAGYRGLAAADDVHLRFHSLTALNDVALADADPPQNKSGNPRRLGYALLHRRGPPGLASMFVSVIEPYRATPFITAVTRLEAGADDQVVLRLQLADGTLDHVLFSAAGRPIKLAGAPALTGTLGFVRERNGRVTDLAAIQASELTYQDARLAGVSAYTGNVVKMNRGLDGRGWIEVDTALPTDGTLVGQVIMIANDNERDACYFIRSVTRDGARSRIDCGPISFVRGYAGPAVKVRGHKVASDYTQGHRYDFDEGARFVIPNAVVMAR